MICEGVIIYVGTIEILKVIEKKKKKEKMVLFKRQVKNLFICKILTCQYTISLRKIKFKKNLFRSLSIL